MEWSWKLGRLLEVLAFLGPDAPVGTGIQRDLKALDPSDTANEALERMQSNEQAVLPVARDGRLVGILWTEDFQNFAVMDMVLGGGLGDNHPDRTPVLRVMRHNWLRWAHGPRLRMQEMRAD